MKKKFLCALTVISLIFCAFLLVACNTNETNIVEVTDVTLDQTTLTMTEGDWETLTATILPANATDNYLEWTSSNQSVVMVENGRVYAVGEGEATITARSNNGKSATCTVTVEAEVITPIQYTVTLHAQGGTFENGKDEYAIKVEQWKKLPAVTVTRGDDYVFTAWYRDEYRTRLWDVEEDIVNDDTNLYAGWKYLNPYQSVIDALANKIKAMRQAADWEVEILTVFADDGYLCFVEKEPAGVFSYKTDIANFDTVKGNETLISQIPDAELTELKNYNDVYNSDNNAYIADCMAGKYVDGASINSVVYSCVSAWEDDGRDHYLTNPPWYRCKVRAILPIEVEEDVWQIFDCSFIVVAGTTNYNAVIGGPAMSQEYDVTLTALGEIADDFYAERVKEQNA